jgi:proton glutamate symport protein
MAATTTSRSVAKDRVARLFLLVGALLIATGFAFAFVHESAISVTVRWIGIASCLVFAVRRPSLMTWTFLAMIAGVELGIDASHAAAQVRLPGDLFLRLIRMIVAPLLFATITTGIAGHNELKSVGRVAIKALVLFEVLTTLGLIIGVVAMNLSGAGWGVVVPAALEGAPAAAQAPQTWQQIILNLFPNNIAEAVAQNQILQVAIFSILFGSALALLPGQKRAPLVSVLQSLADVMFQLTRIIMYLAPLAAGSAIAYTVGNTGIATMLPLVKLVGTYYVALTMFALLVLIPTLVLFRVPVARFVSAIGEPAALGFATTSSESALPLAMERMEEFGVPRWIVSFVIPTGYSFNMTGGSVYLSMAAIFVAQAAGMHLSFARQLAIVLVLMAASKGIAGVPRASLVVLLATASAVHLPTAPILLILGVDTLMDMGRTMMNVIGNCMAAAVIGRTEGALTSS